MQDTGRLPPCIKCVETLAIASEISVNDRTNVFTYDFRIVGVSYNNDDGSSRQEFLKRISLRKKPFDNELRVWVFPYRFIGDHAFYVIVNGFCVGNVPADEISAVRTIYPDIIDACISVDGGDSGKYFGASCTISYKCKMTPAQIELEDDCEFYEKLLARFPNHAPKSFSAYRRMKNANTANYKKLMEAAKRWGIK